MRTGEVDCPYFTDHTQEPMHESDYLGWHAWARKMGKTHRQIKCKGCDRYAIWVPKKRRSLELSNGDRGSAA